ncbi:MAG: 2-succinyl-6-hydroxy-2,4-cyclohexadiene-1-carboxylate synthase [Ignavibacteria bacterium RBG_16_35_7]|nr:MAG: 2-succinyl-6-hydroxy-2,4-cyclohexadiene-1-carboxylate synthase [Ignavibacteria bacterium RBG_16_35_7]
MNVEYFPSADKETTFVFLLHGFTGSTNDWKEIIPNLKKIYSYVAVDLIGHGQSDAPNELELYKTPSLLAQLDDVFNHFTKNKFILIGYSMGGRAALSYATHFPEKLSGLVLESSNAGIANEKLKAERVQYDEKIIKMIQEKSLEEFIEFWMNQDLFASLKNLPKEKLLRSQKSKVKGQKIGLINSLKGFGTGIMPPLHEMLHLVKCRTLLITGELDTKFTQINVELVNLFPSAKHVVVNNAGHNVHLEKAEEFGKVVAEFWEKLK